ncbi:SLC13 family permease [Thermococcus sp.]
MLYLILVVIDSSLPARTFRLIDYESLASIISLLAVSRGIEMSGIFSRIAPGIIKLSRGSEVRMMVLITSVVAASSAVIMNDTAMFIFVPLVLLLSRITGTDKGRSVVLTAIAANVGSALTPVGNPQNIIIWRRYGISIHRFILAVLPYVLVWVILLLAFVYLSGKNRRIRLFAIPRVRINKQLLAASVILLIFNIILIQLGHAIESLVITLAVLLLVGREAILSLDIALVFIFALIFIDFGEISFLISSMLHSLPGERPAAVVLLSAGLSQIISNVPATVLLLPAKMPWLPLTLGVNLGGNGIIVGSLANFIALRISGIGLKEFHRYSVPYFLAALATTLILLLL